MSAQQLSNDRPSSAPTFAAIDLGTNSCRLLIVQDAHTGFEVVDAFSRIVRLGEGISRSGRLSQQAMIRAISALRVCARKIQAHGHVVVRGVTTAACRAAENREEFLQRIVDETGLVIETITTEEEAYLSLLGCVPLLETSLSRALVFDIGGGSTEVMWVDSTQPTPQILDWMSLPIGVVTFSEFTDEQKSATLQHAQQRLQHLHDHHGIEDLIQEGCVQLVGSSSTVATLAALDMNLPRYDRSIVDGFDMDSTAVHRSLTRLYGMTVDERVAHPCVGVGRADLILAGAQIFESIYRMFPVNKVRVADRGVREGILTQLIQKHRRGQLEQGLPRSESR